MYKHLRIPGKHGTWESHSEVIYSYFAHNFNKCGCLVFKPTAWCQRCDNPRCWQSPECRADRNLHADSNVIDSDNKEENKEGGDRNSIERRMPTERATGQQSGDFYWRSKGLHTLQNFRDYFNPAAQNTNGHVKDDHDIHYILFTDSTPDSPETPQTQPTKLRKGSETASLCCWRNSQRHGAKTNSRP